MRPAESSGSDELTFTTWGSDSELAGFEKAIAGFEKANSGATVKLYVVPFAEIFSNIDAQLQSGTAPDIFRVDYDNLGVCSGREQLLDLSDYFDDAAGAEFTDRMGQAVEFDVVSHGVPHHTDTSTILYNKAAFAAAGITSVPDTLESAWTWEEFDAIATQLRAQLPEDRYPFIYNWQASGVTRWLSWLFQADGRFLDEDLSTPAIDSDAGRAAVDFTESFFDRRLVPENSSVKSSTFAGDIFFAETATMTFAGALLLPDVASLAPFEAGATFSPRNKRGGGVLGGNALVATSKTAKPELAAAFLAFMTQEETMYDFCVGASLLPKLKNLVGEELPFANLPELSSYFVQQESNVLPQDGKQIASPAMAAINMVLSDQLEQAFIGGQSTDDTLKNMTDGITQATSR